MVFTCGSHFARVWGCEGEKLTFYCNDKLAFEATGFKPASGHLGFQAEGAALEFRNMRIREIK